MEYPGFCSGSYESQSATAANMRCINWYPENQEDPAANAKRVLYPTPGVEEVAEHGIGPGRAHFFQDGREFAVSGTDFIEIDEDGTVTDHGDVALGSNPATISSNGDGGGELFITSGDNGYIFTLSTDTLTQVSALDGKATMGAHLEGYFLALDAATSTVYASELSDGTTWNTGTSFAQRSLASDPWVSMKVAGRNLWLLGGQTSEAWFNRGASPFAFEPHPSGLIQHGCAAPFSPEDVEGALTWLASSRIGQGYVVKAGGFTPEVISTYPLQNTINGYTTISTAVGDAYNDLGHTFYLLSFPGEITHAWDAQTNLWHERGTWISEDNEHVTWRPRYHVLAFGEHRWLDAETGHIYRTSSDLTEDVDGREIRRLRRAPAIVNENKRVFYPGFELFLEVGLGTATGQGANPQIMLRYSKDGGKTWGPELWRSAGAIGEYSNRARWDRLGQARQLVLEVSVSDPIPWRLVGGFLTPDPIPEGGRREKAA